MAPEQVMRYPRPSALDGDGWQALLALEATMERASAARAREVFGPLPLILDTGWMGYAAIGSVEVNWSAS